MAVDLEDAVKDRREQIIQHELGSCRHFNGIQNKTCKAGITYQQESPGLAPPCIPRFVNARPTWECSQFAIMSREEVEKIADEVMEHEKYFAAARQLAKEDARAKGFGIGHAGQGSVPCPRCGGDIRYRVATYNGHMWGKCSTLDCIGWME